MIHQVVEKIEIPVQEYNFLRGLYDHFKEQKLLLRILEAEENLKLGAVKEVKAANFADQLDL